MARGRVVLVVLLAFFVVLSVWEVDSHPQLGVDEIYYYDYALKSPSLGIRIGEQVGTEAMTTAACRGIESWPQELIPECGDPPPPPIPTNSGSRATTSPSSIRPPTSRSPHGEAR